MTLLVQDERLRYKFGQAARIYAQEHFDIRRVVEKHLDIYQCLYFCKKGHLSKLLEFNQGESYSISSLPINIKDYNYFNKGIYGWIVNPGLL